VHIGTQRGDLSAALGAIRWYQSNRMGWRAETLPSKTLSAELTLPTGNMPARFTLNIGRPGGDGIGDSGAIEHNPV
jgi:hypothetical protein